VPFLLLLAALPLLAGERIGDIEFFGYQGLDIAAIRSSLPVREGEEFSGQTRDKVRKALPQATDVAVICCDESGRRLLFIGLPGASSTSFVYNPQPTGEARLPDDLMGLSKRLSDALRAAVRKGGEATHEDDSRGYALIKDPDTRALQLQLRRWAVGHEAILLRVLAASTAVEHRRAASEALGYARQSTRQIRALVAAARDPDAEVRNNATRALGVLASSNAGLARQIPPETFIEMLRSGKWTDRNKAAALLRALTAERDPQLLAKLREQALDALIEMASWRRRGHAARSRIILGRIAGIPEDRLTKLVFEGPPDAIIQAVRGL